MAGSVQRTGIACGVLAGVVALACAAVALAAPGDPQRKFNAADQATAKAALLHTADLPGKDWVSRPTDFSQANPTCFVKHFSLSALTMTGEAGFSYLFRPIGAQVESDAHVFQSDGQAGTAFATLSRPGLARCIGSGFAGSIAKEAKGAKVRILRITPVPLKGLAAAATGFRIQVAVTLKARTAVLDAVIVNLRHGRSLGSLNLAGPAKAWSTPLVRQLAGKMAARMAKH